MRHFLLTLLVLVLPASAAAQIGASVDGDPEPDADVEVEADDAAEDVAAEPDAAMAADDDDSMSDDDPTDDEEFVEGDYTMSRSPSLGAATGLYRTYQATGLEAGTFGLSFFGEYFGGSDVVRTGDSVRQFNGRIGLSWTPIEYFEVFGQLGARSTTNSLGTPELIQSVGDLTFGGKGVYEAMPGIHVGGLMAFNFPAGADNVGLNASAFNFDFVAMATADLRVLADIPTRFHLNLGYRVDNSEELFSESLDRIDRFGHGVHDYNAILFALAADAPVDYITPFVEWSLAIPTGAPCDATNPQRCISEEGFAAYPSYLTLGAKSAPLGDGLTFSTGFDIGVTTSESQGTPAVPGWRWIFGVSYNLVPGGETEIVEVPVEVPVGVATGHVVGTVVDDTTGEPIEEARIVYLDTDYSTQITDATGRFRTIDFPVDAQVTIEIQHPEYNTRALQFVITEEPREGEITLTAAFTGTRISGSVTNDFGDATSATLSLRGPESYDIEFDEESGADYEIDIEPGEYTLIVSAPGFITEQQQLIFNPGREQLDFRLDPMPEGMTARLTADGIVFDETAAGVEFETGTANLTDAGRTALDEVATYLSGMSGQAVLVRAHTDDQEDPAGEVALTENRARAVIEYLGTVGVDVSMLEVVGAGASEPLYPNISNRNRRRNNRVEFRFVD